MNSRGYHHGDLRAALIAAGMARLDAQTEPGLREIARDAGVSATAVYRHFPDKAALLHALAREGYVRLAADQRAASDAAGGGVAGFNATGAAYVRFALAHPALFRLMFARPASSPADGETDEAMALLRANAEALAPPGVPPKLFALQSWSIAHGLAMLMLDGQVPADPQLIDAAIDAHAGLSPAAGTAKSRA